jgi:hypothetical protein
MTVGFMPMGQGALGLRRLLGLKHAGEFGIDGHPKIV